MDDSRTHDPRLVPGGAFGLAELRRDTFPLHERLHADKPRALRALRAALSPFSVAGGEGVYFVYRQMASDDTFLLQLGLCDVQGDDAPQQAPPCAGGVTPQGLPSHEAPARAVGEDADSSSRRLRLLSAGARRPSRPIAYG